MRVWGLSFDTVTASGLVTYEHSQLRLVQAEAHLADGNFLAAKREARAALDLAVAAAQERAGGRSLRGKAFGFSSMLSSRDERWLSPIKDELREVWTQLGRLTVGLDYAAERRLNEHTGPGFTGVNASSWGRPTEPPDRDDAEWALDYCVTSVLELEERFGPLDDA